MSTLIAVLFDGFSYGMLLFLLSVGLSVTLGLMNFTNLAHGAFAMLGGYVTYALVESAGWPFLATLPLAFLATALVAAVFEAVLFRRIYKSGELNQVLLTIGVVFASYAVAAFFFGTVHHSVDLPDYLKGFVEIGDLKLPAYRIFLVIVALAVTAGLILFLEFTRFGAMVRAAVDNDKVAGGLGLNINAIFALTFALGSGLAGLGGALAIDILFIDPNFGFHILVPVLIVVSIGGLGSIWGSFLAAAALGIFDVAGKFLFPDFGPFLIYLFMVVILFFRPNGFFARR
ncbi:branched-chain amino acid ABC transporter permease [Oricola indica]|uniref:branched-chain amino acid ABC transporter permease n=1 Tax=Oricola indica TaxID=2872591 RepID=UPI003CCB817D